MLMWIIVDWRLQPLAVIVKLWARYHDINNAKDFTISSYSLILMVIHYLQCGVQPVVLPCLHDLYPKKFAVSWLEFRDFCCSVTRLLWVGKGFRAQCVWIWAKLVIVVNLNLFYFEQQINDIDTINMNEKLDAFTSENNQTLGELFVGFLEYFSHF